MRQFDVTLTLDTADPRLRPGTSVRSMLQGQKVDNVLQVPLQAVRLEERQADRLREERHRASSRTRSRSLYRTESRVGLEGLAEGAEVALVDPVAASTAASAPTSGAAPGPVK